MTVRFCLRRRDFTDRAEQTLVIEPVDPIQGRQFDVLQAPPRAPVDHFGLLQAVDRLGERVVVGIVNAADRRFDARAGETFGIADRDGLDAAIAVG